MTLGSMTRTLLLLLGGAAFSSLVAAGLWSVGQYNLLRSPCPSMSSDCLIGITRVIALWGGLYVASLSIGLALLHYDAKYVLLVLVTTVLISGLMLFYRVTDWPTAVAVAPSMIVLLAWTNYISLAWPEQTS